MNCKICKSDLFAQENTIGKPLCYDICQFCWEELKKEKIEEYKKNGCVPITRGFISKEWREWCAKYGLQP